MRIKTGLVRLWAVLACLWVGSAAVMLWSEMMPIWDRPQQWGNPPKTLADVAWMQRWGGWTEREVVDHLASLSGRFLIAEARTDGYSDKEIGDYLLTVDHVPELPTLYSSLLWINVKQVTLLMLVPPLTVLALGCGLFWAMAGFFTQRPPEGA